MPSNRIGRINEEIQRELSDLLRTLKDPRVQKTMVSITRVETTSDLHYAKVWVSVYDKEQSREVLKGLKAAGGFLRHELANRLSLRHTPELVWTEDHSITYGARILDILATLDIPKDEGSEIKDQGSGGETVGADETSPACRALQSGGLLGVSLPLSQLVCDNWHPQAGGPASRPVEGCLPPEADAPDEGAEE